MREKESIIIVWCGQKNPSLGITVKHHAAQPRDAKQWPSDGLFYPHLSPMKDSYNIHQHRMKIYSHQNLLHFIHEKEFIDSPEFESSVSGDEKYQVRKSLCRIPSLKHVILCAWICCITFELHYEKTCLRGIWPVWLEPVCSHTETS